MPGKPRKPPPGYAGFSELRAIAKQHGITISIQGLKNAIQQQKITPDQWSPHPYKPSPLFRVETKQQIAEWLNRVPRKEHPVPKGFTTTYQLLAQAKKISPRITLRHIQVFLSRQERDITRNADQWHGAYVDFHGQRRRLVFPQRIADQFLQMVNEYAKGQHPFKGYFATKKSPSAKTPPQPPTKKTRSGSKQPPARPKTPRTPAKPPSKTKLDKRRSPKKFNPLPNQ